MATVYLATQTSLDRPVVLKVLDSVNAQKSEDMVERFIAEGRIIASLRHPNIITIYDIGLADNSLYISMEYVQGGDLKQRMELPISLDEALDYTRKVATALGEAHKHGIVHRDVKPANILFRDEDTPLLTDFGIAKQVNTQSDLTSTGIFLGSPNYVSPEQADGVQIDGRADIYSLGCIFYEMLTGRKPYLSDSVIDIVIQHKQGAIPQLPKEYQDVQPLLNRMMAKKRDDRFPDAETLIHEVQKLQHERRKTARLMGLEDSGEFEVNRAALRQRRAKQVLGALILLGLVLFSSLKYVEIRIKSPAVRLDSVSTNTVLGNNPVTVQTATDSPPANLNKVSTPSGPPPEQVEQALLWLGRQSLDDYRLTYPPKDNAYYYYTRLLEIEPGNKTAISGLTEIADRYATLAEQSLARNETEKTNAYIDIGLRVDPNNKTLQELKQLVTNQHTSLVATIKSLFSRKSP